MTPIRSILTAIAMTAAAYASAAVAQDGGSSLTITFTGIETQQGSIMGMLVDSEDAYNGKGAPGRPIMIKADKGEVSMTVEGLKPGRYAIKSFHDIDGDMRMGTNPFGMPTEPFAFSNNAVGNMGPAKWADAAFEVKAGGNAQSITIQ